jgi:hypothetical protein
MFQGGASRLSTKKSRGGLPWTVTDHVEPAVAARMRQPGAPSTVTLVVNRQPCARGRYGCENIITHLLPEGARLTVYVKDPAAPQGALELGVGHPTRSFLLFIGDGGGEATQADMPPWPDGQPDIAFDYGGEPVFCGPERACITPAAARRAARSFIMTGNRPTGVRWSE